MVAIDLLTQPTSGPSDISALDALRQRGHHVEDIVALIGKTEGNGCVNDFSRTLGLACWEPLLPATAISVFSGGTEGVLSPHVNFFVADRRAHQDFASGLVAASGRTRVLGPHELGRRMQVDLVGDVVSDLVEGLAISSADVHFVLVKCPLLTPATCAKARTAGNEPVTDDCLESMGRSRAASALGIALALGECSAADVDDALAGRTDVWSSAASASSGAELDTCEVFVLGSSISACNPLRAVHGVMRDAIDLDSVRSLTDIVRAENGTIIQIFAKAEADPTGLIRGHRHAMLTDSDISSTRHARAAVGGLLSAVRGHGGIYVSGGAEHQGPPGGGSVTIVYRIPGP